MNSIFLNSSPRQNGISFNYKLTRTSWWGPLWENNRLLPTSPPKKSDPPPPAVGNKHWVTLKKQNTLFFSSQKCKQFRSITQQTLIKSHKKFIHQNWFVGFVGLACVVRSTLSPPAAKRMFCAFITYSFSTFKSRCIVLRLLVEGWRVKLPNHDHRQQVLSGPVSHWSRRNIYKAIEKLEIGAFRQILESFHLNLNSDSWHILYLQPGKFCQ